MNTIMSVQLDFIEKHRLIFYLVLGSFNYIKGQGREKWKQWPECNLEIEFSASVYFFSG